MSTRRSLLIIFSLAVLSIGCAPIPESAKHSSAKADFGPRLRDADLSQALKKTLTRTIVWDESAPAEKLGQIMRDLDAIDRSVPTDGNRENLRSLASAAVAKNFAQESALAETSYFRLLLALKKESTLAEVTRLKTELSQSLAKIKSKVQTLKPAPFAVNATVRSMVDTGLNMFNDFNSWMKSEKLNSLVVSAIEQELSTQVSKWKPDIVAIANHMDNEKNLQRFIEPMMVFLVREKITVPADVQWSLDWARYVGYRATLLSSAEDALNVFVYLWRTLPAGERYGTFYKISPELADLFADSNSSDLTCLETGYCTLIMGIKRNDFVIPEIESFGVEKIRAQLHAEGIRTAKQKLREVANAKLGEIGPLVASALDQKFNESTRLIDELIANFDQSLKSRMNAANLTALELAPHSILPSKSGDDLTLTWQADAPSALAHAAIAGSFPLVLRNAPSLATARAESALLGLLTDAANEYETEAEAHALGTDPNFSPKSFSQVVRDHSRYLEAVREPSSLKPAQRLFDFTAQNLFPEYQASVLKNVPLFSNSILASLTLSRLSKFLERLKKRGSPVFLIDLENKVTWADQFNFKSAESSTTPVLEAGIVAVQSGKRAEHARAEDIARTIIALCEFLEATRDIEPVVKDFASNEELSEIREGRETIRLLTLAMSNLLSHRFRRADGLIAASIHLRQNDLDDEVRFIDQALAIKALSMAETALDIDVFAWEAVDTYYAINNHLFNPDAGFYRSHLNGANQPPQLPELLEALNAVLSVRDLLPSKGREQLNGIVTPWVNTIAKLRFKNQ